MLKLKLLENSTLQVRLLEQKLEIQDLRLGSVDELVEVYQQETDNYAQALKASEKKALELEKELKSWIRSPLLWAGVGIVTTSLVIFLTRKD